MTDKIFANKRIGILGKGESGKSTITVLLAKAFRNYGYQVCVLDADSTNVGIHQIDYSRAILKESLLSH